jgi:hypothetical protein
MDSHLLTNCWRIFNCDKFADEFSAADEFFDAFSMAYK